MKVFQAALNFRLLPQFYPGKRASEIPVEFDFDSPVGTDSAEEAAEPLRAMLGTGQMQDVLKQRPAALESYRAVLAMDGDSPQAAAARRYLKEPYSYPR